ncbi:DsbA family protein [Halobellus rarus]|uniref:DsbA family protein n=1 Tax=Halobellus rarus TaxID=1126237 RepID=A0ABD6CQL1_9EURY|nr:thioredoxin domain-containing protein [Halobellus rarus]
MRPTRRAYLAAIGGTAAVGATAGCLGGSGSGSESADLPDGCDVGTLESVSSLPRPTLGPEDAPVTVEVFEDFACPHCQTFTTDVYPEIKSNYVDAGDVRYRFFDFPIPVDETWSWAAASAARAVQDRADDETFFAFTEGVYENQGDLSENGYQIVHDLADELGVDGCAVAAAADQEPYREVVEADRQTGSDRDIPGTPAVYVNGELLDDYQWDAVSSAIDSQL